MKQIILLTSCLFFSVSVMAQNIIDKHFYELQEKENTTSIYVSSKLFDIAQHIQADGELKEIQEFVSTIESFNLIVANDIADPISRYKDGVKKVSKTHEELLRISDKTDKVSFYIDEQDDIVTELVGIAVSDNEFIVMSLYGEMDLEKVGEMTQKISNNGLEQFDKIQSTGVLDMKAYPNPVSAGEELSIEVPETMSEGSGKVYTQNGAVVKTFTLSGRKHQLSTSGMQSGYYFVELSKDNIVMKHKILIAQ